MFDESHAETWSIDPFIAFANGSNRPEYYSYEHVAALLRGTLHYQVQRNTTAPLTEGLLSGVSVLVIVHPADAEVHAGVGGSPVFSEDEIDVIYSWVENGGALFVLNEHSTALWKSNINDVLAKFRLRFNNDVARVVLKTVAHQHYSTSFTTDSLRPHPVTREVRRVSYLAGCTIDVGVAGPVEPVALYGQAVLAAVATAGQGRVFVIGDSDIFALPYINQHGNLIFCLNVFQWLATGQEPKIMSSAPGVAGNHARRPSIFLSYARLDHDQVKDLYESLKTLGFDVWLDTESLLPGQRFEDVIGRAVRECDFFIPCFSPNSVNRRGFIQRELKMALNAAENYLNDDIYIIPVRLADCQVETRFSEFQWVDLFKENGLQRLVSALAYGVEQRAQ
ncbi:TIR domain-containing protein [Streptomyces sp. NPDC013978]|uniref:TIR domain-containing protein n=1 Tax=Streptomyces sp. NPDC013978 TaxID=3364869 RepID=UPI0036F5AF40